MTEISLEEYLQKMTPLKFNTRRKGVKGVNGIVFRSMLEANYARDLELRRHAQDPKERVEDWGYAITFHLPTIHQKPRYVRHIVDFWVRWTDSCRGQDGWELIEVKGKETPAGRVKRLWLETHLGQPIEVWRG